MTREILFKAVSLGGKWVEGDLFRPNVNDPLRYRYGDVYVHLHLDGDLIQVHQDTVCQFTGFVTAGKKIKVFDCDKWELHFYSQLAKGYIHNGGTIERLKDGRWICKESTGLNVFLLETMVEDYEGAFEITGNIHDDKL